MSGVAADSPIAPRECFAIVIATLRVKPAIILSLLCISQAGRADPFAELAPLVHQHCTKCHGGAKQNGGLDLRSLRSLLRGGESGPVFHPGKPEESRLVTQLHPDGQVFAMAGRLFKGEWNTALFDLASGSRLAHIDAKMRVSKAVWNEEGTQIYLAGSSGQPKSRRDLEKPEWGKVKVIDCKIS